MKPSTKRAGDAGPALNPIWERLQPFLIAFLAIAYVAPMWAVRDLPMVDLPQHLYALDVMARLNDPATIYAKWFSTGFHPTPYVGYYGTVHLMDLVLPLEVANKLFLSAMVLGWPLAVAALLKSLGRPLWPALLVAPCAYSDSFGWGFINTIAGMALAIASLATFTSLYRSRHVWRARWLGTAALGIATLTMHPVPLLLLALGSPLIVILLASETLERPWWQRAMLAMSAWLPALTLASAWALSLRGAAPDGAPDMPRETFAANLQAFPWLQANVLKDGSQGDAVLLATALLLLALAWRFRSNPGPRQAPLGASFVIPALAIVAGLCYFLLPVSIQPHIQYLSPRFSALAAAFLWVSVPRLGRRGTRVFAALSIAVPLLTAWTMHRGFQQFDAEAGPWHILADEIPSRSAVLNLPFDRSSETIHHPVFLHGAAALARLRGGIPSYSLAGWAQSPFHWRGQPIPSTASEWDAGSFDFARDGHAYDVILMRGGGQGLVPTSWADSSHRVVRVLGPYTLIQRSPKEMP